MGRDGRRGRTSRLPFLFPFSAFSPSFVRRAVVVLHRSFSSPLLPPSRISLPLSAFDLLPLLYTLPPHSLFRPSRRAIFLPPPPLWPITRFYFSRRYHTTHLTSLSFSFSLLRSRCPLFFLFFSLLPLHHSNPYFTLTFASLLPHSCF